MISVSIEVGVGELLDKLTIWELKAARIRGEQAQHHVRSELSMLLRKVAELNLNSPEVSSVLGELRRVNAALWDIESAIRACEQLQDFGETFVALARAVYRHNDRRAVLKRTINELTDSALVEEKSYTQATW